MAQRNRRRIKYRPSALKTHTPRRLRGPRVEIDRGLVWFVVWTQPGVESRVEDRLRSVGLAAYAPTETIEILRKGALAQIKRRDCARYVFVGLKAGFPYGINPLPVEVTQWSTLDHALEGTPLTSHGFTYFDCSIDDRGVYVPVRSPRPQRPSGELLRIGDLPLRVPAGVLQRFADDLNLYHEKEDEIHAGPLMKPGTRAKVKSGPWKGWMAEIQHVNDQRVRALIALFGTETKAEFERDQLEVA